MCAAELKDCFNGLHNCEPFMRKIADNRCLLKESNRVILEYQTVSHSEILVRIFYSQWRVLYIFLCLHQIPSIHPLIKANCLLKIWLRTRHWWCLVSNEKALKLILDTLRNIFGQGSIWRTRKQGFRFLRRAFSGISCTSRYNSDSVIKIYTQKSLWVLRRYTSGALLISRNFFHKESIWGKHTKVYSEAIVNENLSGSQSP